VGACRNTHCPRSVRIVREGREGLNVTTSNNALERPRAYRGRAVLAMNCVLGGAETAPCPAAQLGR
jgi:hypothetical protein